MMEAKRYTIYFSPGFRFADTTVYSTKKTGTLVTSYPQRGRKKKKKGLLRMLVVVEIS